MLAKWARPPSWSAISSLPFARRLASNSIEWSKWSSIISLPRLVMISISVIPAATASSTMYWIAGLSTRGNISFGIAFDAGSTRVPSPAAGITAFLTAMLKSPLNGIVHVVNKVKSYNKTTDKNNRKEYNKENSGNRNPDPIFSTAAGNNLVIIIVLVNGDN